MAVQPFPAGAEAVGLILNKFQCQQWLVPFAFPENLSRTNSFCFGDGSLREMWG